MTLGERPTPVSVGLFVSCPVDLTRPSVAWAAVSLLEQAGCKVQVPQQSCCGQVGYNSGETLHTQALAKQLIEQFEPFDYVVVPSGSCAGMIKHHYPRLLEKSEEWRPRATVLAEKTFELTQFLSDVLHFEPESFNCDLSERRISYHDSCAGLRELGIKQQPRQLLKSCANATVVEMENTEICCGFGGTFSVKFPDISNRLVSDKLNNATDAEAELLLGGDLSCLLNIAGKASRLGRGIEVRHVAEVLAGHLDVPAIGRGERNE